MSARARRVALVGLLVSTVLLVTGCLSMPTSGPVVETRSGGGSSQDPGFYINPKPPQPGDTRAEIVRGFLVAMTATPIQTNTAKEFLTDDAAAGWNPENKTITYVDPAPMRETSSGVSVTLPESHWLDEQGAWQGAVPRARRAIEFPMSFEDGEWRIDAAPDALIVPESWFEQRFRSASLYYFDPTAQILTPEPVYVPRGRQLTSTLTQALLLGPGARLDQVAQSFIPPGLKVSLSVPISEGGIADIALRGDAAALTPDSIELMMVQLAWTLRQVPEITALRVSVNGDPLPLPGGASAYRIDGGAEYDPAGYEASSLLYALRDGRLASGSSAESLEPVSGPMGAKSYGVRTVAVSIPATSAAGVSDDGRSVLAGPVTDAGRVRTVYSGGTDLLPPAWDFADRMWLVDRTDRGARITWVRGQRSQTLVVRGVTGQRVRDFVVSRDGTRLIAVIRGKAGDSVVVSRIAHDRRGRVLWASPARVISRAADNDLPIRAIAWHTPTVLAMLSPFSRTIAQVRDTSVDGSPAAATASTTVEGRLRDLAGSPAADEPLYGVTPRALTDLSASLRREFPLADGVTDVDYVG